jgi:hypothetical protein
VQNIGEQRQAHHYSTAAQKIPLRGLEENPKVKPMLLSILGSVPINQFLRLTTGLHGVSAILLSPSLPQAVAGYGRSPSPLGLQNSRGFSSLRKVIIEVH